MSFVGSKDGSTSRPPRSAPTSACSCAAHAGLSRSELTPPGHFVPGLREVDGRFTQRGCAGDGDLDGRGDGGPTDEVCELAQAGVVQCGFDSVAAGGRHLEHGAEFLGEEAAATDGTSMLTPHAPAMAISVSVAHRPPSERS